MKFPINALYASHFDHARMGGQKSLLAMIEHFDRSKVRPFAVVPAEGELSEALRALDCPTFVVPFEDVRRSYLLKRWLPEAKRFFRNVERLRSIVRAHRINVIHPDEVNDALTCGYAKIVSRAKLVFHVRLTISTKLDRLVERLCDGIIGVSEGTQQRFSAGALKKFRVIFDGLDFNVFKPYDDKAALRKALDLPTDAFILLFVGQVKAGKGIFDLLDAMTILKEKSPDGKEPLLLIAGKPIDDFTLPDVLAQIQQQDLNARFLGHRNDVHRYMQACDVLALPSHEGVEGLPRALVEGMACGAIGLGTDTSGLREAFADGNGIVVREKSPMEIASAILNLMRNPDLQAYYRQKGLESVRARFDVRANTQAIERFYAQML
ncbi:MAG: glycosyltransferase family 4 protein [Chloroherpetonaceae bacterium]|nr:glycosyltransferase family 4 protein [Chloroherpetonaceae bacterium]MDW8437421.1 glycosyltransferase family 4 protein [Chloroherpetonaceae bacterium]